jgi:hypothetical protein
MKEIPKAYYNFEVQQSNGTRENTIVAIIQLVKNNEIAIFSSSTIEMSAAVRR